MSTAVNISPNSKRDVVISVRGLSTTFGDHVVHKELNLDVFQNEILGVVGGSGSGKSVLMQQMIGLMKPQSGDISYRFNKEELFKNIGVLFQTGALISSLSVIENIILPLKEILGLPWIKAYSIAMRKISDVGLSKSTADKIPAELSGGMIKRVALARALAIKPKILFLDEPTAGLDPTGASGFDDLILQIQSQHPTTIFMITHDLDSLHKLCDRVAVIVDQHIICDKINKVVNHPHPWIQEYFHGDRGKKIFN